MLVSDVCSKEVQKIHQKRSRHVFYYLAMILTGLFHLQNAYAQISDHKTMLILGDSLSAGYGVQLESSWVELLRKELSEDKYNIINASISGETTDGGLRALPKLLEQHEPEVVIIELGANDGLRGFPLPTIRQNLSQLIQSSQAIKSQVLLVGMHIPPNYGKRYAQGFHQIYHELSEKYGVALLPFLLEDIAIHDALMQEDRLHPNEQAQPIIKEHVLKALKPLL